MSEKQYVLEEGRFPSADGSSSIAYYCYRNKEKSPRAILQISHGMKEYITRYEPLIEYLTGYGFLVAGMDHSGHGKSVSDDRDLGFTGGVDNMVTDLHTLSEILTKENACDRLILIGHSMGSFLARLYAARYAEDLDGLVLVGTAGPGSPTGMGKALAALNGALLGRHHRSPFLTSLAFGSYNKRFKSEPSPSAWLTRDRGVVEAYDADKYCNYTFTAKGYYDLFDMLGRVSHKGWAKSLRPEMPVLVLSGAMDPVGGYGKGVTKVVERMKAAGMTQVSSHIFPDMRHEVFNEIGKEQVYEILVSWLETVLGNPSRG